MTVPTPPTPQDEQLAWQHALHEERVLNERAGLFLVAEAMLLVFYATLKPHATSCALHVFAFAGLIMSGLWMALNRRQARDLEDAVAVLKEASGFYDRYLRKRLPAGHFRTWDRPILVFVLPTLVAVVWLVLLLMGTGILGL